MSGPFVFCTRNGVLYRDGAEVARGYSGHGKGKNNPDLQNERGVGPIPAGDWEIVGDPFDSPKHGLFCMRLEPMAGTETFDRTGILVHGDSKEHPGEASEGCIVLPPAPRHELWNSGERVIRVVTEPPAPDATPAIA